MTERVFALICGLFIFLAGAANAQTTRWVQIEAQPSLTEAQNRARAYSAVLPDVSGFSLGGGWYGIVLGPYSEGTARERLLTLRSTGQIPRDSFLADPRNFGQRFWPIGPSATAPAAPAAPATTQPAVLPSPQVSDETPREARQSEQLLTRPEREQLQVALRWEGFYNSTIDGAFGRGTRRAMGEWQAAKGYEATGVLTTKQRAELLKDYNSILDGIGLQPVTDSQAGISVKMPTTLITFEGYDYPFAKYAEDGQSGVRVVLLSQEGGRERLAGLYDLMQSLRVVPEDGPRELRRDSFTLQGSDSEMSSYTFATLADGAVKGFTLVWPAGDERRLARVIEEMRASFTPLPGAVLTEAQSQRDAQSIDLIAGLEIRTPDVTRSGFFVTPDGAVLTTSEIAAQCTRLTIGADEDEAEVLLSNPDTGIAVLRPKAQVAPHGVATLQTAIPRLQSEVALAGFSYGGVLSEATLTYGRLADIKGLRGEAQMARLALEALPGDAGGPVFDEGGTVVGMLLPKPEPEGRDLPGEVAFALKADEIAAQLQAQGIALETTGDFAAMDPIDLAALARDVTTTVSCWR